MKKFLKMIYKQNIKYFIKLYVLFLLKNITILIQPFVLQNLIDAAFNKDTINTIVELALLFMSTSIVSVYLFYLYNNQLAKWKLSFEKEIEKKIIITSAESNEFMESGDIIMMLTNDVSQLEEFVRASCIDFPMNFLAYLILLVIICSINIKLSSIVFLMNILIIVIYKKFDNKVTNNRTRLREEYTRLYDKIIETARYSPDSEYTGIKNYLLQNFQSEFSKTAVFILKDIRLENMFTSIIEIVEMIGLVIVIGSGCILLYCGNVTVGVIVSFIQYFNIIISTSKSLLSMPLEKSKIKPIFERLSNIFMYENEKKELKAKSDVESVNMKKVSFSYHDNVDVLKNVNFNFKKGKLNVIVGKSGSGKTTIFRLLMKKLQNFSGKICFDDEAINDIDISSILGYMPQEDIIFCDTVLSNIRLDDEVDDEIVKKICKNCYIDQEIANFEKGYDTIISPENINVSGGQMKRLMLARLLLRNKKILLLDEPTVGLDAFNAEKVIKMLSQIAKEKLVIIITHNIESLNGVETNNFYI